LVHSEYACDEFKVRFSQGDTVLAESNNVLLNNAKDACVAIFMPPSSPRVDDVTVLVLNQDDVVLAEKDVSRHFNECNQYDSLDVDITIAN